MICEKCGGKLGRRNKIGVCRACINKEGGFAFIRNRDPEAYDRARIEGMKRRFREDPEYRAKNRENILRVAKLPQAVAARRESGRRLAKSGLGIKAQPPGSEARKQQARTLSQRKLAWCPEELRKEYLFLLRSKRMKKDEARAIILEQHEANIRNLRRKMGVDGPVLVPDPVLPRDGVDSSFTGTYARAEVHKAEKARIEALKVERSICPICGSRGDIGCQHSEAA